MNDIEFRNLDELYNRVHPALYSKVQELKRNKISYIKEVDIWNYLSKKKWQKGESLSLADMVSDILYLPQDEINNFVLELFKRQKREIMIDEEGTLLWRKIKKTVYLQV